MAESIHQEYENTVETDFYHVERSALTIANRSYVSQHWAISSSAFFSCDFGQAIFKRI